MKKTFREMSQQDVQTVSGGLSVNFSGLSDQGVGFSGKVIDDVGVVVDDTTYLVKTAPTYASWD